MAGASGSMAAARGSQAVGESWWMLCRWEKVVVELLGDGETAVALVSAEAEEGRIWEAREVRRLRAVDMVASIVPCLDGEGGCWGKGKRAR